MSDEVEVPRCGAGFAVMHSGAEYDGNHRCIKDRLHDEPHLSARGFMWGMVDQTRDPWFQWVDAEDRRQKAAARAKEEKRRRAANRWYRKLAERVRK